MTQIGLPTAQHPLRDGGIIAYDFFQFLLYILWPTLYDISATDPCRFLRYREITMNGINYYLPVTMTAVSCV